MILVLLPFIPFLCSVILLGLGDNLKVVKTGILMTVLSTLLTTGISVSLFLTSQSQQIDEYYFSSLFKLPGTTEFLSISLLPDTTATTWLLYLSAAMLLLNIFAVLFFKKLDLSVFHLAVNQLLHAGLITLFLAGSMVTSLLGWGITLIAIILSNSHKEKSNGNNQNMGFMILMLSIFCFLATIFVMYGVSGHLAYGLNTEKIQAVISAFLSSQNNRIVIFALHFAGFSILLSILPGLGLLPITSWLDDTRGTHIINKTAVFVTAMPAGIIILQRYEWFLKLVPAVRFTLMIIAILTLILSWIACYHIKSHSINLPWLATTGTALLTLSMVIPGSNPFYLLFIIYPSCLALLTGRIMRVDLKIHSGRFVQIAAIIWLPLAALAVSALKFDFSLKSSTAILFLSLAMIPSSWSIFKYSNSDNADKVSFQSSLGYYAYNYFGSTRFIYFIFAWPAQQIAEGFWILESGFNLFFQFGIGRVVLSWSRLFYMFDKLFIKGSTRWLETKESRSGSRGRIIKT